MRAKILTLRFSPTLAGFDDGPLQDFVRDKDVLAIKEHFFSTHDVPHIACVITWQDHPVSTAAMQATQTATATPKSTTGPSLRAQGESIDPTQGLGEADRMLFQTLRRWRSDTARRDGAPPYIVLTNRQLLALIQHKPMSRNALGQIDGFGPAKLERYGEAVLAMLRGCAHSSTAASSSLDPLTPPQTSASCEATPPEAPA